MLLKHYYTRTSIQGIARQQTYNLGDIIKSRSTRGTQEEMRKQGARRERRSSLQWSLINFHFNLGNPGTLQSVELSPQTCHRLEKWQLPVKFRQPRALRIYFLLNHFCDSFPLHQSQMSFTADMFFYPLDMENQRVRSDKNSILWFSLRLQFKSPPYSGD